MGAVAAAAAAADIVPYTTTIYQSIEHLPLGPHTHSGYSATTCMCHGLKDRHARQ
jgi:hypothetical protein